ncbi:unnamed protein product, partial [Discosporangium mesarthrocarpum]
MYEQVVDLVLAAGYFMLPISVAIFISRQDLRVTYALKEDGTYVKVAVYAVVTFVFLAGLTHIFNSSVSSVQSLKFGAILKMVTALVSAISATVLAVALPKIMDITRKLEVTQRGFPEELQRVHQMVYDNSTHMISVHDQKDGRFLYVNRACSSFGLEKEELLNTTLFNVIDSGNIGIIEDAIRTLQSSPTDSYAVSQVDNSTSTVQAMYYVKHREDGRVILVDASLFFGKYTSNIMEEEVLIITWRDVTEKMELEARSREQEKIKTEAMARQRFISSIAHDLKTPLTSFQLSLGLLQASASFTEEERQVIQEAEVSLELMSVTIGQAIDFSRVTDTNQLKPKRGSLDLHKLVYKCEKILSHFTKGVPIYFNIAPEVSRIVITDGEWIWQMCVNLLTNALKYTTEGWIRLDLRITTQSDMALNGPIPKIDGGTQGNRGMYQRSSKEYAEGAKKEVDAEPAQDSISRHSEDLSWYHDQVPGPRQTDEKLYLCFSVSDTGIGVPDEMKAKLFQPFSQIQAMQSNGTGLGLYSVRQKARRLAGDTGIVNNPCPEGGSVFYFTVPYVPDEEVELEPSDEVMQDRLCSHGVKMPLPEGSAALATLLDNPDLTMEEWVG